MLYCPQLSSKTFDYLELSKKEFVYNKIRVRNKQNTEYTTNGQHVQTPRFCMESN